MRAAPDRVLAIPRLKYVPGKEACAGTTHSSAGSKQPTVSRDASDSLHRTLIVKVRPGRRWLTPCTIRRGGGQWYCRREASTTAPLDPHYTTTMADPHASHASYVQSGFAHKIGWEAGPQVLLILQNPPCRTRVFLRARHRFFSVFQKGREPGLESWVAGLEPREGELVIPKQSPSAFFGD
jgi:hypothetical protein